MISPRGALPALAILFLAAAAAAEPNASPGSSIVVAGQTFEVGRPVVLWSDPQGFDAYQVRCIDQTGGCCDTDGKRFGARKDVPNRTLDELQKVVSQFVLHFDGCVNSRSCFKSMHNRPRPRGSSGCGLSAHFMIDADGTIYQTLDLMERAFHAEEANSGSVGVEICNRGRVDRSEWPKLPPDYRTRPTRDVVINGEHHEAYDFRPEQYDSIVALTRTLLRVFPRIKPVIPEKDGQPLMDTLPDPLAFAGILGHLHVDQQRQKWDPGALDWRRILRALNGFEFPVQIRSFTEVPRTQMDLLSARRAAFFNAEERASGFFPIAPGRFWHSGVHIRATAGTTVRAPTRGRIIAAVRELLEEGTFHESTVEQVADRAGVARATVYQHFGSRLGLVDAMCETFDANPALLRLRETVGLPDSGAALAETIANTVRFWSSENAVLRELYGVVAIDPAAQDLVERQRRDRRSELERLVLNLSASHRIRPKTSDKQALELLLVLTSYETYRELALAGLSDRKVIERLQETAATMLLA
ncbi:MAG: N-acetylmuramoyl-L-alanine amidase [Pseudomonadota bacterium]